jgi:hypothetical protein
LILVMCAGHCARVLRTIPNYNRRRVENPERGSRGMGATTKRNPN